MRRNKYLFVFCMLLAITLAGGIFTKAYMSLEEQSQEDEKLRIVTSFYPVYIAAANIVGDTGSVLLENLSEPQTGCLHDYQLTPQDMILLSKADLFLVNGGGIEGFLEEAGETCPELAVEEIAEGVELLEEYGSDSIQEIFHESEEMHVQEEDHGHGAKNAHGWMDTRRYCQMVRNMADVISQADQEHGERYQEYADDYCEKIQELTDRLAALREKLEEKGKSAGNKENGGQSSALNVVIFHEAFAYVADELGLNVVYCLNLDEERQVSAGELADLLAAIQEHQVSVILAEETYGRKLGETVESETDCQVYYLDTLVRGQYETDSYLKGAEKNIEILEQAAW